MSSLFAQVFENTDPGTEVPEVPAKDLAGALDFLERVSLVHDGRRGYSFVLDQLATHCAPSVDSFAAAIRALALRGILDFEFAAGQVREQTAVAELIESMARMPFLLRDLDDLETVRERLDREAFNS